MIELPFPASILAAHATIGKGWAKAAATKKHRAWAHNATLAASDTAVPASGDIRIIVTFYPANRRGDRVNFPNRMKPYFDGIADALKVNDSRFLPTYLFGEPVEGGKVVVVIGGEPVDNSGVSCLSSEPLVEHRIVDGEQ